MTTGEPRYGADQTPTTPTTPLAGDAADSAYGTPSTDTGQSATDTVKDKAGQVADKAQQAVSQATDKAQQQAKSQLTTRKGQAADSLTDVAHAVHQVGDQLRQNDRGTEAQYADMAAHQVDRFASYLRDNNLNDLLDDVQGLARRQPALFLAGAFALGVLGARFLKSSTPTSGSGNGRYRAMSYDANQYGRSYQGGTYGRTGGQYGSAGQDWRRTSSGRATPWGDRGAPYGAYDPGSQGVDVREIPQ